MLASGRMTAEDAEVWKAQADQTLEGALGPEHPFVFKATTAGAPKLRVGMVPGELAMRFAESLPVQLKFMEELCIPELERQPVRETPPIEQIPSTAQARVRRILARFHAVVRTLRQRHAGREPFVVEDEYDVQDLLAALLAVDFEDVRREEPAPSYAGKSSRVDLLLKREQMVVEAKFAKHGHADKEIGTELIDDITRYRSHPDCKRLVCFIYDPTNALRNATGLEEDMTRTHDNLPVEVVVAPKP